MNVSESKSSCVLHRVARNKTKQKKRQHQKWERETPEIKSLTGK